MHCAKPAQTSSNERTSPPPDQSRAGLANTSSAPTGPKGLHGVGDTNFAAAAAGGRSPRSIELSSSLAQGSSVLVAQNCPVLGLEHQQGDELVLDATRASSPALTSSPHRSPMHHRSSAAVALCSISHGGLPSSTKVSSSSVTVSRAASKS